MATIIIVSWRRFVIIASVAFNWINSNCVHILSNRIAPRAKTYRPKTLFWTNVKTDHEAVLFWYFKIPSFNDFFFSIKPINFCVSSLKRANNGFRTVFMEGCYRHRLLFRWLPFSMESPLLTLIFAFIQPIQIYGTSHFATLQCQQKWCNVA